MTKVKALILRGPGTNCDTETAFAFQEAGAMTSLIHIGELIRGKARLSHYQIVIIPGGFTYGDDVSAGKVLANELRLGLYNDIERFIADGGLIMGICNGFQVLVKAGILPGPLKNTQSGITLAANDSGKFECRWVHLRVNEKSPCVFTKGIKHMYLPSAHAEGKVIAKPELLESLNVVLRYTDENGSLTPGYPHNPNGSIRDIAGICDGTGRIFALMPHPERYIRKTQHPQWMRHSITGYGDGFQIFVNAVHWAGSL